MWILRKLARRLAARFTIGISGILFDELGRVYVQKHRFWAGQSWGLPGGHLDYNETMEEAILREIKEECNLDVEIDSFLTIEKCERNHYNAYFVGRVVSKENFKLQILEVLQGGFFYPQALPEPFMGYHKNIFKRFEKELKPYTSLSHSK
jgi:8-oxo-dGTP diphosphatase